MLTFREYTSSRDGSGSGIGGDGGGEEWLLLGIFYNGGIVVGVCLVKTFSRVAVVIRS